MVDFSTTETYDRMQRRTFGLTEDEREVTLMRFIVSVERKVPFRKMLEGL